MTAAKWRTRPGLRPGWMKARRALVYVTVWNLDMADRGAGGGGKSLEGPLDSDWRATEDDWADFLVTGPDFTAADSTSSGGEDSNRSSLSYTISSLFFGIDFLTDFFWLREVIRERNINVE